MAKGVPALLSPEEHLQFELDSSVNQEFLGGLVHAMSGGTNRSNEGPLRVTDS